MQIPAGAIAIAVCLLALVSALAVAALSKRDGFRQHDRDGGGHVG